MTSAQGGGLPFDPATLFAASQKGVWYDPSDLSTLFQNSNGTTAVAVGDPVGYIADKSGNGRHAIQATAGNRPTLQSSGGLFWLQFDGSNDTLAATSVDLSASSALGWATSFTPSSTSTSVVAEFGANVNATNKTFALFFNFTSAGQLRAACNTGGTGDSVTTVSTSLGNGVTSLVSFQNMDITQAAAVSKLPLRVNGAAASVTVPGDGDGAGTVFSSQTLNIGARSGGTFPAAMKLYGMLLRGTAFSAGELGQIESYMGAKAGLSI